MALYIKKQDRVDAVQWLGFNKQTEDPRVSEYDPYDEETEICSFCNKKASEHGWCLQAGQRVCIGDWIVQETSGIGILHPDEFEENYALVEEEK